MSPDDERHGDYAGYVAHIKAGEQPCAPCRAVGLRTRKRNTYLAQSGSAATIPNLGTARRINALRALGYSSPQIAAAAGLPQRSIDGLPRGSRVYRATAEGIARAFERLSMAPLPVGRAAAYNRTLARKHGWAPPLAWDDIDDPSERPSGHRVCAQCQSPIVAKGLCINHYNRARERGDYERGARAVS